MKKFTAAMKKKMIGLLTIALGGALLLGDVQAVVSGILPAATERVIVAVLLLALGIYLRRGE